VTTGFDLALPLGAIGLYLYDSVRLLYGNEMLFEQRGRTWQVHGGADFLLSGRRPCLPNPLTPGRLLFSARWSPAAASAASVADVAAIARLEATARVLRPVVMTLLVLLIGALPAIALGYGAGRLLLALFALYYGAVVLLLVLLWMRRHDLALSGSAYIALCADALLCAPFAVNLIRKLSLRAQPIPDPFGFAVQHLQPEQRVHAFELMRAQASQNLQMEEPLSPAYTALEAFLALLRSVSG